MVSVVATVQAEERQVDVDWLGELLLGFVMLLLARKSASCERKTTHHTYLVPTYKSETHEFKLDTDMLFPVDIALFRFLNSEL
eukprot:scaffold33565_cov130-Skeletonema_dohrnii-CCMP3373.AAC.3